MIYVSIIKIINIFKIKMLTDIQVQGTIQATSTSPLNFLEGKNIFVFDTETTGLPAKCPNGWGSYWSYFMNEKYDSSRIISLAWSVVENYTKNTVSETNTKNKIEHYHLYMILV